MGKGRLEAFSDGVLAIIITIMVLELKAPEGGAIMDLLSVMPTLAGYVISFVFVGIYWVNHHRLLEPVDTVSGKAIWANLLWLFFVSMIPFATAWSGECGFSGTSTLLYSMLLLLCGISYQILSAAVTRENISKMLKDRRNLVTLVCYAMAAAVSYFIPLAAYILIIITAAMWIIPMVGTKD